MNPGDHYQRNGHPVTILQRPDRQGYVDYQFDRTGERRRCPAEQLRPIRTPEQLDQLADLIRRT